MATVKISSNLRFTPVDPDAEVKSTYEKKIIEVRTELNTLIESEKKEKEKIKQEKENLESKYKRIEIEVTTYKKTVTEYETRITTINTEYKTQYENFRNERNVLIKERDDLRQLNSKLQNENSLLKNQISDLNFKVTQLNDSIITLNNTIKEKNTEIANLNTLIVDYQTKLKLEELDDLNYEKKIASQQITITGLNQDNETHKNRIRYLEEKLLESERCYNLKDMELLNSKKLIPAYLERIEELEATIREAEQVNGELETNYNNAVNEKEQINATLLLKITLIKELEEKYNSFITKYNDLQKSIETFKITIKTLEEKELYYKKIIGEHELKITSLNSLIDMRDSRINTLNSLITSKDNKINQLNETIRQLDARIKDLLNSLEFEKNKVIELNKTLEIKIIEIHNWQKENEKDDSLINELRITINNQNQQIEEWKKENARDDARIAELTQKLKEYENIIIKLRDYISILRVKFNNLKKQTVELEIVDEKKKEEIIKKEISVEEYKRIENECREKESSITVLKTEILNLQNQYNEVIQQKNNEKSKIDCLEISLKEERLKTEEVKSTVILFEERINTLNKRVEVENSSYQVAQTKVKEYKEQVSLNKGLINEIIGKIQNVIG